MAKQYEYVEAESSKSIGGGKIGDKISRVIVIPTNVVGGVLSIKDGNSGNMVLYDVSLHSAPVTLELGLQSKEENGWTIVTGIGITAIIIGEW